MSELEKKTGSPRTGKTLWLELLTSGRNLRMRKALIGTFTAGLFFFAASGWGQTNKCDLTGDGKVDTADIQAAINMSLGIAPCTATVAGANVCNVIVVQRVVNASQGAGCFTSTGLHVVALTWA